MRTVVADRYQGKRFSRPNDLVVRSDGSIYFTDMPGATTIKEIDFNGVLLVKEERAVPLRTARKHSCVKQSAPTRKMVAAILAIYTGAPLTRRTSRG